MIVDTYQRTVEVSLDTTFTPKQVPDKDQGGWTRRDKTDNSDDRFVGYG